MFINLKHMQEFTYTKRMRLQIKKKISKYLHTYTIYTYTDLHAAKNLVSALISTYKHTQLNQNRPALNKVERAIKADCIPVTTRDQRRACSELYLLFTSPPVHLEWKLLSLLLFALNLVFFVIVFSKVYLDSLFAFQFLSVSIYCHLLYFSPQAHINFIEFALFHFCRCLATFFYCFSLFVFFSVHLTGFNCY